MSSHSSFLGYYYLGSDEVYHYFKGKWKLSEDDRFKVKKSCFVIPSEFPVHKDEIQIRQYKLDGDSVFFKIGDKLYYAPN